MGYKFLDSITSADVAFEASGRTEKEMLTNSGLALFSAQVRGKTWRNFERHVRFDTNSGDLESLLFRFLSELVFLKDSDGLLFGRFELKLSKKRGRFTLEADAYGNEASEFGKNLIVDVKAVSMHKFSVKHRSSRFVATVVLDV